MVMATYFDGQTSLHHEVRLALEDRILHISGVLDKTGHPVPLAWPVDEIAKVTDEARDSVKLYRVGGGDARLVVADKAFIDQLAALHPRALKPPRDKRVLPKVTFWTVAALCAFYVIIFQIAPRLADIGAVFVSRESEVAIGRSIAEGMKDDSGVLAFMGLNVEDKVCDAPEGVAAFEKILARLTENEALEYNIEYHIYRSDVVNAFTLPGGQIVVFDGLFFDAGSPEEVAAVLAHEIGHAEARDPLRSVLRAGGISAVLSVIFGDTTGGVVAYGVTNTLISAKYSQEAETHADEFAFSLLERADLPIAPFAEFFERLDLEQGNYEEMMSMVSTHPLSVERAEAARIADDQLDGDYEILLTDAEWYALQDICFSGGEY